MANLTSKLKNRARREEQRENWSAAIELYSRALRAGERNGSVDVSLYNRIGDIYLRLEDVASAVGSYERAIVRYAEQDLYTSAIALCNKVLRIQPSRISTYLQLGRLQLATGLVAEGRVNYLRYATELLTRDQSDEAHAALEEYVVRTEDLNSALRFGGALVANDRGEEALSLFQRLKERLEGLGRDTEELERPMAAIRGFGARPDARGEKPVQTVEALEAEIAGALEEPPSEAVTDPDSIVDLEAELEAAVGGSSDGTVTEDERVESSGAPESVGEAEERMAGADAEARVPPERPEAPGAAEPGERLDVAAGMAEMTPAEASESVEAPDLETAPVGFIAEPEAPEVTEEEEGKPRVPAEDVERIEPAPGPWRGAERVEAEPAEAESAAFGSERRPAAGSDPGAVAEPVETDAADPGAGAPPARAEEPVETDRTGELAARRDHGATAEPAEVDTVADDRADSGPAPRPGEDESEPVEEAVSAPELDSPWAEPREVGESWDARSPASRGDGTAPAPESSERIDRSTGSRRDRRVGPDRLERPVRPSRTAVGPSRPDAPEADALAPAARLAVELADEDAETALEEAIPPAPEEADGGARPEAAEPALPGPPSGEPAIGRPPSQDASEALAEVAEAAAGTDGKGWPATETIEDVAGVDASVAEADAILPASPEPVEEMTAAGVAQETEEAARLHLERGLDLKRRGELEEAIRELELASEASASFLQARTAIEECRAALAPSEPEVETSEPEAESTVEEEPELLPEAAVGPHVHDRASWLFSPAAIRPSEGTAETELAGLDPGGEEALGAGEREPGLDARSPRGQPPDEPFRAWLAAAEYDVLARALEELERREELARALCVVERMLEQRPAQPALHRVRIAHAAELGLEETLPDAYLELGAALEEIGDLRGARGAYERVAELDPERPEADERLAGLEHRIESLDPLDRVELERPVEASATDTQSSPRADPSPGDEVPEDRQGAGLDAGETSGSGDRVQVYRGVVQDLGFVEPAGAAMEPLSLNPLDADREATVDFDVILAELKEQLADGVANEPDGSSRTEVGERLMDMGLLDDAIRELQAAIRSPDAPPRAFELLGQAFVEKGQARVASRLLSEALEKLSTALEEERLLGVLYQLGIAHQESETPARALECYERIFSVDIDYRDVRERIEACAR